MSRSIVILILVLGGIASSISQALAGGPIISDADVISDSTIPIGQPPTEFRWPLCAPIAAGFGDSVDGFTGQVRFHSGLDFVSSFGAEVHSVAPGRVVVAGRRGPYGLLVEIDHGRGYKTRYAQLQMIMVRPGQLVGSKQPIGRVGSTGHSTGPHLHFEVWYESLALDPQRVLKPNKDCVGTPSRHDTPSASNDLVRVPEPVPPEHNKRFAWPLCAHTHAGFGYRRDPYTGRTGFHAGLDMISGTGIPVRASAKGRVVAAEERGAYGLMIEIDHGGGYRTRYGQLHSYRVRPGDMVSRGQVIGAVGSTGRSTGPHLHFEIWFLNVVRDPLTYLEHDPACWRDRR